MDLHMVALTRFHLSFAATLWDFGAPGPIPNRSAAALGSLGTFVLVVSRNQLVGFGKTAL